MKKQAALACVAMILSGCGVDISPEKLSGADAQRIVDNLRHAKASDGRCYAVELISARAVDRASSGAGLAITWEPCEGAGSAQTTGDHSAAISGNGNVVNTQ